MIAYCGFTHANSSVRATRRNLRDLCLRCILYKVCRADFGAMAQLVAHLHGMERVRGSNPLSSTDRVSGDFRKPFFHTQIRNPNQHPNSSSHWRKPDAARHLTVQKPPPSGGILPPTSLPASQNLQSLEKTRRNQAPHSPDPSSHWNI